MSQDLIVEQLFESIISGDRPAARSLVQTASRGVPASDLVYELFWPTYELVERLYRQDQLTKLAHCMGTKLLRQLVDQHAARLDLAAPNGRTVFACCGPSEADELGAQMSVDLMEAAGYSVRFAGGGIPADEILAQVHETRPDFLILFASAPGDLPDIRKIIDTVREIGACPSMRIVVGGGVFNRAEGLAEEIGAHASARDPLELVETISEPLPMPAAKPAERAATQRRVRPAA